MRYSSPRLIAAGLSIGGLLVGHAFALLGCSSEEGGNTMNNAALGTNTSGGGSTTMTSTGTTTTGTQAAGDTGTGVASMDQGNTTTTTDATMTTSGTGMQAAAGAQGMDMSTTGAGGAGLMGGAGAPTAMGGMGGAMTMMSGGSGGMMLGAGGANMNGGGSGGMPSAMGGTGGMMDLAMAGSGGQSAAAGAGAMSGEFTLTSAELEEGASFNEANTCTGGGGELNFGVAIPLEWSGFPAETQSFALTMIDVTLVDGPSMDYLGCHSFFHDLPASVTSLPATDWSSRLMAEGAVVFRSGYLGPCPPNGPDTYEFTLYAMPEATFTPSGNFMSLNGCSQLRQSLEDAALDSVTLSGTYVQP